MFNRGMLGDKIDHGSARQYLSRLETYILVGKRSWGITLSKDESKLYVANGFGDDITVIDVKSRKATVSIPVGRIPWGVVIDE